MQKTNVRVKKIKENAVLPIFGSAEAAGADLTACLSAPVTLQPGETRMIPIGIAMEIPPGYAGLVFARSGLASRRGLAPANKVGVVDSDYRGEFHIALRNHSREPQTIRHGDRIAQMLIMPVLAVNYVWTDTLSETERGSGGFGSTGE